MDSKEKLDNFRKLRNSADAFKDIALLKSKNPTLDRLNRYERNPSRYADEILYDLLDCCSSDKIVKNRKGEKKESAKPKNGNKKTGKSKGSNKNSGKSKEKTSNKPKAAEKSKETKPEETASDKSVEQFEVAHNDASSVDAPENKPAEDSKKK